MSVRFPAAVEAAVRAAHPLSRRGFLAASGAVVVGMGAVLRAAEAAAPAAANAGTAPPAGPYPDPDFLQLDTWIVIHPDNTATFFVGKTDGGQGTGTAFHQMMCDELDIAYDRKIGRAHV